jgi:hypothetical protein
LLSTVLREATQRLVAEARQALTRRGAKTKPKQEEANKPPAPPVDLEDIEKNGVAWSQALRRPFSGQTGWSERLAALLNVATICRENGRPLDELAALRMARRMTGGESDSVNQRIAECREIATPGHANESGLRIVSFHQDRAAFEGLLGSASIGNNFHHPGAEFGGLKGVNGRLLLPPDPAVDNVSFAICDERQRLAVVPCVIQRDDVLSWVAPYLGAGGIPITIHFDETAANPGKILNLVLRHLDHLLQSFGARQIVIREPFPDSMLLYKALGTSATFSAEIWDRPVVPLAQREDEIFAKIRNSYKSHVNWGRSNLLMEYLTGDQLNAPEIDRAHQILTHCHQKLIEKYGDGMSRSMFLLPILMCQMKKGEVAIARTSDGTVCGITVVTDEGGISNYALGGSIPQQNKNPGQFIVYDSIIRAKTRGSHSFHMNREYYAPVSVEQLQLRIQSAHDTNLTLFKRGYGDLLEIFNVYKVLPRRVAFLGR